MPSAPALNKFTPIHEPEAVARYLRYMLDFKCDLHCGVQDTDIRFDSKAIHLENGLDLTIRFPATIISTKTLHDIILGTLSRKVDLNYTAQDILIFASTDFRALDKNGIRLKVCLPIYKLQRRQSLRVKPGSDTLCEFIFPKMFQTASEVHRPYDISTTGFSLMLSPEAAVRFPKNAEFNPVTFRFNQHMIQTSAKVVNVAQVKGPRLTQIKVGFKIDKLPLLLEQDISRYAYLATQKILGRRI